MVQEHNQERPPIARQNPPQPPYNTGGGYGGGYGGGLQMPPPRNQGGGVSWLGLIIVAVLAVVISVGACYYILSPRIDTLQTLPASVDAAISSLNAAVTGIPASIATQVSSAISTYEARLHDLENGASGYLTTAQLNHAIADATADFQSQIDAVLDTIDSNDNDLQEQITALQDIIDNSDIQHNSISVVGGGLTIGFVVDSTSTIANGFATANITVQITNNKNRAVTLKELILNISPHLQNSNLPASPSWLTSTTVSLSYTSLYGTHTTSVVGGNYTVDINNMALVLNANGSATITFLYRFNYGADSTETLVNVQTFISNLLITPTVTMANYILGS